MPLSATQSKPGDRCDLSQDGSAPSPNPSSSSSSSISTSGIDPTSSVILALEYLADGPTRLLVLLQRAALLGGIGLLAWELAIKLDEVRTPACSPADREGQFGTSLTCEGSTIV